MTHAIVDLPPRALPPLLTKFQLHDNPQQSCEGLLLVDYFPVVVVVPLKVLLKLNPRVLSPSPHDPRRAGQDFPHHLDGGGRPFEGVGSTKRVLGEVAHAGVTDRLLEDRDTLGMRMTLVMDSEPASTRSRCLTQGS